MTNSTRRRHRIGRAVARMALGLSLIATLAGFASFEALFAPKSELWPRWQAHDPAATMRVDHAPWSRFLGRYVVARDDGINRVAYGQVSPADRKQLDSYIAELARTPVALLARAEQRAYWINLYNALTVRLILDHPEAGGIREIDISPGFLSDGPWGKRLIEIGGEKLGLNDIEHRILRPIWRDPRIHYALNCASLGCPNLQAVAFTAGNTEALLDAAARAYINHPRGAAIADGKLVVSSIYVWFQDDFGGNDAGIIAHLKRYAAAPLAAELMRVQQVADHAYDWDLNAEKTPSAQRRVER